MRREGDLIKINEWLLPMSWIYGSVTGLRNRLFDIGILKSRAYKIPVISVGNITVGGTGKTPHVEYLIRLLQDKIKVAVLSRGYKRKSKGYVLADADTQMSDIGDEPYQMMLKYPNAYIAHDLRYGNSKYADRYTKEQYDAFTARMAELDKYSSDPALGDIFLGIYANPIDNQ